MSDKKIIAYKYLLNTPLAGCGVHLCLSEDHPGTSTRDVYTSNLVSVSDDGILETQNTIYSPVKKE